MPCHVLRCECSRFTGTPTDVLCPVCSRAYAGRSSLEIHLYAQHPGLSVRERSLFLRAAVYPIAGAVVGPDKSRSVIVHLDSEAVA